MRQIVFAIAALGLLLTAACSGDDNASPTPTPDGSSLKWEQLAKGLSGFSPESGSFDQPTWAPGRFPIGLQPIIAFNGDLWMNASIWSYSSSDGTTWTQHEKTDTGPLLSPRYAFFDNKLWLFGGMKVPPTGYSYVTPSDFSNEIWSSTDGSHWERAGNAEWPGRRSTEVIEFQGKLWLFGGADHVDQHGGSDHYLNDIWKSDDGLHWMQVTDAAAWSPRDDANVVIFNDQLYLLGGQGHPDIWRSANGKDWTQLTPQAGWGEQRFDYGAQAFDGKLWVYGGYIAPGNRDSRNDAWYSPDGVTWTRDAEHEPWSSRGASNSLVWKDKLWIFSGKATGQTPGWRDDIWTLGAPTTPQ